MTITEYLEKQPKSLLVFLGILLFVLGATADYLTHDSYLVEFFPFYLVPLSFFSWFIGRRAGIVLALVSLSIEFFIRAWPAPRVVIYWDAFVWSALYLGSALMISQLKTLYERERHLSRIDPLTMIENRRAFFEFAARAKSFSERHNTPLSVAYLDLDEFKQLNDRLGHATGDKVLVAVAASIRKALRPTDVVARIGGDEFAVLLPGTDKTIAERILARVRCELDEAMRERNWPMTFSMGLASFSPPMDSVQEMIQAADRVMYAAKNDGKNAVLQPHTT